MSPAKQMFIDDSEFCRRFIPIQMIYTHFTKEEYNKYYRVYFPEKFSYFYGDMKDCLGYYKNKEDQLNLLFTTYKDLYGEELLDNLDNVNECLMTLLDTRRRVELAEKLIEKDKEDETKVDSWICYLTCDMSIPKFKKKIYATSDGTKRQSSICYILDSCRINDDMSAILEILTYYNQRHRNEQEEVTHTLLIQYHKSLLTNSMTGIGKRWIN